MLLSARGYTPILTNSMGENYFFFQSPTMWHNLELRKFSQTQHYLRAWNKPSSYHPRCWVWRWLLLHAFLSFSRWNCHLHFSEDANILRGEGKQLGGLRSGPALGHWTPSSVLFPRGQRWVSCWWGKSCRGGGGRGLWIRRLWGWDLQERKGRHISPTPLMPHPCLDSHWGLLIPPTLSLDMGPAA